MSIDTLQNFTIFDSTDSNSGIFIKQHAQYINPTRPSTFLPDTSLFWIDTVNNYVWTPGPIDSELIYKLDAKKKEQWVAFDYVRLGGTDYDIARITDKWQGMLFNKPTTFMSIKRRSYK